MVAWHLVEESNDKKPNGSHKVWKFHFCGTHLWQGNCPGAFLVRRIPGRELRWLNSPLGCCYFSTTYRCKRKQENRLWIITRKIIKDNIRTCIQVASVFSHDWLIGDTKQSDFSVFSVLNCASLLVISACAWARVRTQHDSFPSS